MPQWDRASAARAIGGIAVAVSLAGWLIRARKPGHRPDPDAPSTKEQHHDAPDRPAPAEQKSGWDKAGVIVQAIGGLAIFVSLAGLFIGIRQFNDQQKMSAAELVDQQHQTTLNDYFDDMSDLVLNHKLISLGPDSSIAGIAVARTATALRDLAGDGSSEGSLIRYLWEAGLILGPKPVLVLYQVDLNGAEFQNANLYYAYLSQLGMTGANFDGAGLNGANLSGSVLVGAQMENARMNCMKSCTNLAGAYLIRANLSNANLTGADLKKADLDGADLSSANLDGADLQGAFYNVRPEEVKNEQGKPVINMPTRWPGGFDPKTAGATCDDC
jgi:hypothetical protein